MPNVPILYTTTVHLTLHSTIELNLAFHKKIKIVNMNYFITTNMNSLYSHTSEDTLR